MRLDPHRDDIVRMYLAGDDTAQIAKHYGCHQETVRALLQRLGIPRRHSHRRHSREAVLVAWHRCHNQHQIAKELDVSQTHVCRILHQAGIRVGRGTREPIVKLAKREVIELYKSGLACQEIADRFGTNPEVIRMRLKKWRVSRRPRGSYERRGPDNPQWKGGRLPPMHYHRRQSYEVVAICLGRPLPRGWVIHHFDEDPTNNDPSNLCLFPSLKHHTRFHQQQLRLRLAIPSVEANRLAIESGGRLLPLPRVPIELSPDTDLHALLDSLESPKPPRKASARAKGAATRRSGRH